MYCAHCALCRSSGSGQCKKWINDIYCTMCQPLIRLLPSCPATSEHNSSDITSENIYDMKLHEVEGLN